LTRQEEDAIIKSGTMNGWNKLGYFVLTELRRHNDALKEIYAQQTQLSMKLTRLESDVRWYSKVSGAISGVVGSFIVGVILLIVRYEILKP